MTHTEALSILEAMADGCSPLTGEVLPHYHLLLDESVMEAILIAIESMQGKSAPATSKPARNTGKVQREPTLVDVSLPDDDLMVAVELYRGLATNPTATRLSAFLCGDRSVKDPELTHHPLFGKYGHSYQKADIVPWMDEWIKKNNINPPKENTKVIHPFFAEPHFNKLSERAIEQLKEKVSAIPLVRVEGLSEELLERRKTMPRSHEPWPEEEQRLLKKAIEFTNDVTFLAQCFGRSELAVSAQAEKWLPAIEVAAGE